MWSSACKVNLYNVCDATNHYSSNGSIEMSEWFNHNFAYGLTNLSCGFKHPLQYKEQHDYTKGNHVLAPIPRSENSAHPTYAFRSHCKCFLRKYA